jgi:hypothetical protein
MIRQPIAGNKQAMPTWEFHLPWERDDLVEELVQAADSVGGPEWRGRIVKRTL